jgi:two-component system response regulator RegX3
LSTRSDQIRRAAVIADDGTLPREENQVARILVVDEKDSLSQVLSQMLCRAGYETSLTGSAALTEYDRGGADVVLLDLILPGVSGIEILQRLQSAHQVRPIDTDGTEPYPPEELVARIREALQADTGGAGEPPVSTVLTAGPVRMDLDRHVVTVAGAPVRLPLKEFQLLELLLRNVGRVLTRRELIARVWGTDYVGDTKTLDVHIRRLRSKIEAVPSTPRHIVNVRSLGFKFEP